MELGWILTLPISVQKVVNDVTEPEKTRNNMNKIPDLQWPASMILMVAITITYAFSTIPDIDGNKGFFDGAYMALQNGDMLAGACFALSAILFVWFFFTLLRPKK